MDFSKVLAGKKTYIILAVTLILGVIESWNSYCKGADVVTFCTHIEIPGFVYSGLAALGIYTRSLVNK